MVPVFTAVGQTFSEGLPGVGRQSGSACPPFANNVRCSRLVLARTRSERSVRGETATLIPRQTHQTKQAMLDIDLDKSDER
jgi:hypothetical protein